MSVDTPNYFAGLGARPAWPTAASAPPPAPPARCGSTSKTEALRQALREQGPMTALQLALATNLQATALVGALLKYEIARGRVRYVNGKYEMNAALDAEQQDRERAAVVLLRRLGYTVIGPQA